MEHTSPNHPNLLYLIQKSNTRGLQLSIRRVTPEVLTQEIFITWTLWLSHLSPQQVLHNKFASLEPYDCQLHLSSLQVSHSNSASLEAYHCQFYLPSKQVLHNKSASLGPYDCQLHVLPQQVSHNKIILMCF
jgi:hypothetical protein